MRSPTVYLNGTSGDALRDQYARAVESMRVALYALCDAGPSSRDYYPQGTEAATEAQREHESRVARLKAVREELHEILESIEDQIAARESHRGCRP